ncbi:beta-galactosidase [Parabacteroides sp. PF5-5]|uniref:sugar-binding domain-containing protein n=1 Tax=unclassified Parabacteroides TaxID=2649774 RepID=UPI002473C1EA|nr:MULTISPECIES: sugar-binding domain-containing protein [unclassified Parabacteroides]MDH6303427.1 beta-galactosidase [Parabacteroides sp. PH5-39]MDH6314750.1 beta-galactosidase [Parabacteroides sp. PF5-13]MDH6318087.1 beta-galactosidase [Parabacteroides sp. PH5-13]MDH6321982.1 beta-galactosidase [Parabacteroides sp. PH5-8]MDH6326105.1 beta-galactosidase [Parabacteroides sp. PH5-41]
MRVKPLCIVVFCLLLLACTNEKSEREKISFNKDWQFFLTDDTIDASNPALDDSGWRTLNLPHDWSIEADFNPKYPARTGGGALPGGNGWYRKHFKLPESDKGKMVYIDFDGVYRNSTVWLNGHLLGNRPNGYISFRYDLTPHLKYGKEENILVVHADNSEQPNSRWYSGSGIYRNVWLVKTHPIHVDLWGTYVTTPVITDAKASVSIETTIRNNQEEATIEIVNKIVDASGKIVAEARKEAKVAAKATQTVSELLEVSNPQRWTLEDPYLYTVVTEIISNKQTVDSYQTPLGIRTLRWDPATGFYLNEKATKILGVCMHHDLGCLGAAINYRALTRQVEILKEMGVNSIRTSHNPPTPELLEICDRMGILVQDESFDMWRRRKSRFDYARSFDEWHEKDLTDQILRDRNHPSVFMWSIGNEVLEQWTHANADTLSLQQANLILNAGHHIDPALLQDTAMSVQSLITHTLASIARKADPTRVITAGCNEVSPGNHLFRSEALDVYGFNYHHQDFAPFPKVFPGKVLIVSESTSGLMSRGIYEMPSDQMYIRPDRWDRPFDLPEHICSSYDNCHVPWGSTHEETWREVKKYSHISGMYVWTGFDYLGEPTPYGWPSRSSFFGIIDLAGIPKDVYYMYQSEWTDKPVLHIFPHWNWEEGQEVDVWAYYNQADEVELFLNGESMGKRSKTDTTFHVSWRLKYSPGTLKAISRKNGQVVMSKEIHTAGEAAQIVLSPDRTVIQADGTDLSFVTVEVKDKNGNLVPNAANLIRFSVEGKGFIAGTDNGNQNDPVSLKKPERHAFSGKAMVVVQNTGEKGEIRLKASSEGLPDSYTVVQVK